MSRELSGQQQQIPRDYGATSSSTNAITSIPDVNFSGFSPTEFMSLSEAIAKNISSIMTSTSNLEQVNRLIDSNRDKSNTHENSSKLQADTNLKIEQIKQDIERLTKVIRHGDKSHKLQVNKLTSDFSRVVNKYSKVQQSIATKRKRRLMKESVGLEQDLENSNFQNLNESDRQQLIEKQKQLAKTAQFEQNMMIERESRVKEIEGNLLDINKTMKDIAKIVNQQGEQINTIEIEIDNTAVNVEEASSELHKAANHRQSYRRKILILLIIAVILGLIVTGIVVSKLKS